MSLWWCEFQPHPEQAHRPVEVEQVEHAQGGRA